MGDGEQVAGRKLKGVGIDCAQILVEVYSAVGVIEWFSTGRYVRDWMMHQSEERYLALIIPHAEEYDWREEPIEASDIVVWRFGKTYSHGGIVTKWPRFVHAYAEYGMVEEGDASVSSHLTLLGRAPRPMRAFRMRAR